LIKQRLLAAECRVFGDTSATEIVLWNLAKFATEKWGPCSRHAALCCIALKTLPNAAEVRSNSSCTPEHSGAAMQGGYS